MNFEKLEALIGVMSNEQFARLESAVFNLLIDNKLFTTSELSILEKKIQNKKLMEREKLMVANN